MDQLTHNVRRTNWLNIINQCQERPANITVRQRLKDNDIKEKSYYYLLRKFRKESYDQMQLPATAIIRNGAITLEISNDNFRGSTKPAPKGGNPCWRTLLKSLLSCLRMEQ